MFFDNAEYIGTLGEDAHQLKTDNIPFLSRFRNLLSGGISQFPCKIYYIRTAISREIGWGSNQEVIDPVYSIALTLQGYGGYKVQIVDEIRFLSKLMGVIDSTPVFYPQDMDNWFKSQFMEKIESAIGEYFQNSKDEVIRNCSRREKISEEVSRYMAEVLDDYGVKLVNFAIERINVPKDDPNRITLDKMRGEAAGYKHQGSVYKTIQGINILQDLVNNPGAGGIAGTGAALGMGIAAGGVVGGIVQSVFTQPQQPPQQQPQQPTGGNSRFGVGGNSATSNPVQQDEDDLIEKLATKKKELDQGLIGQSEYDEAKREVMAKLRELREDK